MLCTQKKITAKEVIIRLLIIVSVCEKFFVLFFVWTLGHCKISSCISSTDARCMYDTSWLRKSVKLLFTVDGLCKTNGHDLGQSIHFLTELDWLEFFIYPPLFQQSPFFLLHCIHDLLTFLKKLVLNYIKCKLILAIASLKYIEKKLWKHVVWLFRSFHNQYFILSTIRLY